MKFKFTKRQFETEVRKIFTDSNKYIQNYKEIPSKSRITFEVSATCGAVEYKDLKKLSKLLGTSEIGFEGEFEYGYYEEIDQHVAIYCNKVEFYQD